MKFRCQTHGIERGFKGLFYVKRFSKRIFQGSCNDLVVFIDLLLKGFKRNVIGFSEIGKCFVTEDSLVSIGRFEAFRVFCGLFSAEYNRIVDLVRCAFA